MGEHAFRVPIEQNVSTFDIARLDKFNGNNFTASVG